MGRIRPDSGPISSFLWSYSVESKNIPFVLLCGGNMMSEFDEVTTNALALPVESRVKLAELLIQSLAVF
jgi:hypothetical protein